MGWSGSDRRTHKVFVTRNTEYHLRGMTCVGVRDRRSGEWLRGHQALRQHLSGALRFSVGGGVVPNTGAPQPGESLYFCSEAEGSELVTSAIVGVERPNREIVRSYAA